MLKRSQKIVNFQLPLAVLLPHGHFKWKRPGQSIHNVMQTEFTAYTKPASGRDRGKVALSHTYLFYSREFLTFAHKNTMLSIATLSLAFVFGPRMTTRWTPRKLCSCPRTEKKEGYLSLFCKVHTKTHILQSIANVTLGYIKY